MHGEKHRIATGMRSITNKLGAVRCPSLTGKAGTVIECGRYNAGLTVLLDGPRACIEIIFLNISQRQDAQLYPSGA
jgi:hypothetical protein